MAGEGGGEYMGSIKGEGREDNKFSIDHWGGRG